MSPPLTISLPAPAESSLPVLSINRESWLTELAGLVARPLFGRIAPYRVTCGWPCHGGLGVRRRVVGECHPLESSKGGVHEIFISPVLDNPLEVSGTVCHELAHVAAGKDAGHGPRYARTARAAGLTKGKPTQAMPGEHLADRLRKLIDLRLGPYPHLALRPVGKLVRRDKRDVGLGCAQCGCRVRISLAWLSRSGTPRCGCGGAMFPVAELV